MVYLSHNWGMGDSDCMPCYEPVDVHHHHRTRTTSTGTVAGVESVNHTHHVDGPTITGTPSVTVSPASLLRNGVVHCQQLPVGELSRGLVGGGGGGGAAESDGQKKEVLKAEVDHQVLLRKPLTPAASEDHHDSDYDEISIHPLSNQVSDCFLGVCLRGG